MLSGDLMAMGSIQWCFLHGPSLGCTTFPALVWHLTSKSTICSSSSPTEGQL